MLDYTVLYTFLMKVTALVVVPVSTVETGNVERLHTLGRGRPSL